MLVLQQYSCSEIQIVNYIKYLNMRNFIRFDNVVNVNAKVLFPESAFIFHGRKMGWTQNWRKTNIIKYKMQAIIRMSSDMTIPNFVVGDIHKNYSSTYVVLNTTT